MRLGFFSHYHSRALLRDGNLGRWCLQLAAGEAVIFNVEDDLDALVRECAAEPDQRMLRLNGIATFLWGM